MRRNGIRGVVPFFGMIFAILVSLPRLARADDTKDRIAAMKAMLDAQTKAVLAHDRAAFRATLTADGIATLDARERPAKDFIDLITMPDPDTIQLGQTKASWFRTWGVVAAELVASGRMHAEPAGAGNPHPKPQSSTYHWLAVVVADGKAVKAKAVIVVIARQLAGTWKVIAVSYGAG